MMPLRHALLALLLLTPPTFADEVVFYRCTDSSGALTLQNMPCPKGDTQVKKVMQGVTTVPAPAPTRSTSTPPAGFKPSMQVEDPTPPAALQAGTVDTDAAPASKPLPPPVLFQCTTHDKDSYISEDADPAPRCVVLRTTGLDGNPQSGAGEACEVMRDQCARVPDGALCGAWKKRLGETEVALRFGRPEHQEKNRAEHERVQDIISHSACTD